jgi:hypothetical protein
MLKGDTGARSGTNIIKSGSATATGTPTPLVTSGTGARSILNTMFGTDPATSAAWTQAGVNAATPGYMIAAQVSDTIANTGQSFAEAVVSTGTANTPARVAQSRAEVVVSTTQGLPPPPGGLAQQIAFTRGNSGNLTKMLATQPVAGNTLVLMIGVMPRRQTARPASARSPTIPAATICRGCSPRRSWRAMACPTS